MAAVPVVAAAAAAAAAQEEEVVVVIQRSVMSTSGYSDLPPSEFAAHQEFRNFLSESPAGRCRRIMYYWYKRPKLGMQSGHCSRSRRRHSARKTSASTGGVWLLLMPQKRLPQRTLFCSLLRIWRIQWISHGGHWRTSPPCSSCHWRTWTPCRTCRRPHRRVSSPPEKVQTSTCRLRQVRVHHIPQVRFHRLPQASEVPLRRRLRTSVMIIGAPLGGPGF